MNHGGDGDGRLLRQSTNQQWRAGGRYRADGHRHADVPDIRASLGLDLRAGHLPDQRGVPPLALRGMRLVDQM